MLPLASVYVAVPALVAVIISKLDGLDGSRSRDSEASGDIIESCMSNHRSGLRERGLNAPSSPEKLEVNGLVNDWVNPSVTASVPSLRASFSSLRLFFRIPV
jgi:hypothetical protein